MLRWRLYHHPFNATSEPRPPESVIRAKAERFVFGRSGGIAAISLRCPKNLDTICNDCHPGRPTPSPSRRFKGASGHVAKDLQNGASHSPSSACRLPTLSFRMERRASCGTQQRDRAISPSHPAFVTDVILNEAKGLNASQYWFDLPALPLPRKQKWRIDPSQCAIKSLFANSYGSTPLPSISSPGSIPGKIPAALASAGTAPSFLFHIASKSSSSPPASGSPNYRPLHRLPRAWLCNLCNASARS